MASLNKVMLIGNLGRDPEIRNAAGQEVANFSIGCSESWNNQNGEQQSKTEWVNIVCWRAQAGYAKNYLKKGSQVFVEGKMQTRKWQDKDGNDRYTIEVLAMSVQGLDKRQSDGQQTQQTQQTQRTQQPVADQTLEDDLPF